MPATAPPRARAARGRPRPVVAVGRREAPVARVPAGVPHRGGVPRVTSRLVPAVARLAPMGLTVVAGRKARIAPVARRAPTVRTVVAGRRARSGPVARPVRTAVTAVAVPRARIAPLVRTVARAVAVPPVRAPVAVARRAATRARTPASIGPRVGRAPTAIPDATARIAASAPMATVARRVPPLTAPIVGRAPTGVPAAVPAVRAVAGRLVGPAVVRRVAPSASPRAASRSR